MLPRYTQIKSELLEQIESGQMKAGDKAPSENQLAEQFDVSRMTARRALTELVDEGFMMRTQGLGTFVSDHRPMSSMLSINSIDEEIINRGHQYTAKILMADVVVADEQQSNWLGLNENAEVFRTRIVHLENIVPLQLEDRLVNPKWVPEYLHQNYNETTTSRYLSSVAPLTEADHMVEAILIENAIADILDISPEQPCLKISRRTFSAKGIISYAQLYHPGNRYRIGGHLDF
ncbi:histidine utilization repressor [Alteromonadaceae bacterium M269]|nr:histidine utilization repressor [Alteromonadaceae bacterium M269]